MCAIFEAISPLLLHQQVLFFTLECNIFGMFENTGTPKQKAKGHLFFFLAVSYLVILSYLESCLHLPFSLCVPKGKTRHKMRPLMFCCCMQS